MSKAEFEIYKTWVAEEGLAATNAALGVSIGTVTAKLKEQTAALIANTAKWLATPVGAIVAVAAAILGMYAAAKKYETSLDDLLDKYDELQSKIEEFTADGSEYDTLKSKVGELTVAETNRLAVLEAELAVLREQSAEAAKQALSRWRDNTMVWEDTGAGLKRS